MIDGIATLTMITSTMIIATPIVSATRPSQRLRSLVAGSGARPVLSARRRRALSLRRGHSATPPRRAICCESGCLTSVARRSFSMHGSHVPRYRAGRARRHGLSKDGCSPKKWQIESIENVTCWNTPARNGAVRPLLERMGVPQRRNGLFTCLHHETPSRSHSMNSVRQRHGSRCVVSTYSIVVPARIRIGAA